MNRTPGCQVSIKACVAACILIRNFGFISGKNYNDVQIIVECLIADASLIPEKDIHFNVLT
jgi:hypothetical protein